MLLKNTAFFRKNWKVEQGYDMPHWDENFIGASFEEISGFYKMVNGIVHNIKADLTPKLQNAQDAQAIYEFLQNAADSQATECAILYNENYFLALNNGKPFTEADIKAVLNSFQGTKADKTKPENCAKIGRYGIGFKLVHRLVGKFDGADELLNDLAGPILFSWNNKTQLETLKQVTENTTLSLDKDYTDDSPAPWLLKIALSCFPVAPEEQVKDLQYKEKNIFSKEEVLQLAHFLRQHESLLQSLSLAQGSIIFLKFGEKKYEKLKESLLNLKSGIGYSLNLLKTLKKVVLIDEVIERFAIQTQHYHIPTPSPDFQLIAPEFPSCPIEISIGYETTQAGIQRMKDAPSLYQYFPMRNERHNLAFFIHATSFNKVTDRTHLDDQGEANFATFAFLCKALQQTLVEQKTKNFEVFTQLYQVFLLSDAPNKYNSLLLNKHLYQPILQYIRAVIPTAKQNTFAKELIIVKKTQLPIEPMQFGIAKEWFYWTKPEDDYIKQEALKPEKLGLTAWTLKNMLSEGQPNLINEWFSTLSALDYEQFIIELKQVSFDKEFLNKFSTLKAFRCIDQNAQATYFSLEELKNQAEAFLVNQKSKGIAAELKKLGFLVLEIDINELKELQNALRGSLDYLFDNKALYQKIVSKINQNHQKNSLTIAEKHNIFTFLTALKEITSTQLQEISLFTNQEGKVQPLKSMIDTNEELPYFLQKYKINTEEYSEKLLPYLLKKEDVYNVIIQPFWENIILSLPNPLPLEQAQDFIQSIKAYFQFKKGRSLQDKAFIYSLKTNFFEASQHIFYDNRLTNVENYQALQQAFVKLAGLSLPEPSFLKILSEEPFKATNSKQTSFWTKTIEKIQQNATENTLNSDEKWEFFKFLRQIGENALNDKIAIFTNEINEKQLPKHLLPPDSQVPTWLVGFKIKQTEFREELRPYLCRQEDIYNNIVLNLWDIIVAQTALLRIENITDFYATIKEWFAQNRNNKPINQKKCIFISKQEGFESATQVFFNQACLQVRGYNALQRAIHKLTSCKLPDKNTYTFLAEPPFKIVENLLIKSLKNTPITLADDEAVNLIQLGEIMQESLFEHFIFEETAQEKEYLLSKRGNFYQAFAGKNKSKMHEAVQTYLGEKYKILPEKLFVQSFENKGLVTESTLAQELLKYAPTEALADMLAESTNPVLLEKTLSRLDEIVFRQGVLYDKNSAEYQAILLFKQKDAPIANILPKLFFEDAQGFQIPFSEFLHEDAVSFLIEKQGKYLLKLSQILPRYQQYESYLAILSQQFIDLDASILYKKLQGFLGEKDKMQIWQQLLAEQEGYLPNAMALAFVVLCSRAYQQTAQAFKVRTKAGERPLDKVILYLQAPNFIDPQAVLSTQYEGIAEHLGLGKDKRPVFSFTDSELRFEPFLDKTIFKTMPLAEGLAEKVVWQEACLTYLYEQWLNKPTDNLSFENLANPQEALGFNPYALVEDTLLALPEEEMPTWLVQWQQNEYDNKNAFLKALGVQTTASDSLKIRQYFLYQEGEISLKQLRDAQQQDKDFISKIAGWLRKNVVTMQANEERLGWLKKLYNLMETTNPELPLPYIYATNQEDQPIYKIEEVQNFVFYHIDDKKIAQLREKYQLSLAKLLSILQVKNIKLTQLDLKILPTQWLNIEEKLDKNQLLSQAFEWAEVYYEQWKQEYDYTIYWHKGEIPYQLWIQGELVHNYNKGNSWVEDKTIFVNAQVADAEDSLVGLIPQNAMLQLFRIKNQHSTLSKIPHTQTKPATSEKAMFEALKQALSLDNQYDTTMFNPFQETNIITSVRKAGQEFTILLKETAQGKIKFKPKELKLLNQPDCELWVWDNLQIARSSLEELKNSRKITEVALDLQTLDANALNKLAELLANS